jgi:hypothetical protein
VRHPAVSTFALESALGAEPIPQSPKDMSPIHVHLVHPLPAAVFMINKIIVRRRIACFVREVCAEDARGPIIAQGASGASFAAPDLLTT